MSNGYQPKCTDEVLTLPTTGSNLTKQNNENKDNYMLIDNRVIISLSDIAYCNMGKYVTPDAFYVEVFYKSNQSIKITFESEEEARSVLNSIFDVLKENYNV